MIPALLAAAGGAKILGNLAGGIGQGSQLKRGLNQFKTNTNLGTQALQQGIQGANEAYSPYTSTGATGAAGQLAAVQGRQQAAQPTLTGADPSGVQQWLNPMATWAQNQATRAATAAGVATGATGGGMQRAISADAVNRANTNWNDAYNQMLQANAQNFGQQQQQYQNQTAYDQSQIENLGALANRGLLAVGGNQGINQGYIQGINQNYGNLANAALGVKSAQGQLFNNTATNFGNNLGGLFSQITPKTGG